MTQQNTDDVPDCTCGVGGEHVSYSQSQRLSGTTSDGHPLSPAKTLLQKKETEMSVYLRKEDKQLMQVYNEQVYLQAERLEQAQQLFGSHEINCISILNYRISVFLSSLTPC